MFCGMVKINMVERGIMELKFKENPLWKIAGSLWLLISFMNLGLIVFLINGFSGAFGLMLSPLYVITIFISCLLAVNYFRITRIDYIRISEHTLSIYKGLVFPRKKTNFSEVEEGRVLGNKLILILKNEKEVELNLKLLTVKDFEKMKKKLEEYFKVC